MPDATASLELRTVGSIRGSFWVDKYQRGYRWGPDEVRRLLDDIWDNGDRPYSLQPVVVKSLGDERWELVDGQQRLTTLYLVYRYMADAGLHQQGPLYSIEYATRPDSKAYLEKIDPELRDTSIDHHHLCGAYDCIQQWFQEPTDNPFYRATRLYLRLQEHVRVIWYEAPAELDSTTLFTRLNVGRIPLTDAELVKAELLRSTRPKEGQGDRSHEIAAAWDAMERDLRREDVWAFVNDGEAEASPTRISLLLDTLADHVAEPPPERGRPRFHTFLTLQKGIATAGWEATWNRLVDLHALVLGWYEDRDVYHKVGFLITIEARTFGQLQALSQGVTHSAFQARLDEEIRQAIKLSAGQLQELDYTRRSDARRFNRVLLLMNVETVRRTHNSTERYPFRLHRGRAVWSLEHIHAQRPEGLNRAEQWESWLTEHRAALVGFPIQSHDTDAVGRRDTLIARIDRVLGALDRSGFEEVAPRVSAFFTAAEDRGQADLHGIRNLALLSRDDNSQLNNAVFEVKRRIVLQLDREGAWIPPCTRRVFLKYYTDSGAQQLHFWSRADREAYLDAMIGEHGVLVPYLKPEAT